MDAHDGCGVVVCVIEAFFKKKPGITLLLDLLVDAVSCLFAILRMAGPIKGCECVSAYERPAGPGDPAL